MIAELGHFALALALAASLVQGLSVFFKNGAAELGVRGAFVQCGALVFAFAALMTAYAVTDLSVLNVAENSHAAKPLIYKLTGTWGNHEGSVLMWTMVMALYGAAFAATSKGFGEEFQAKALSVLGFIAFGFLAFVIITSNPFARLDPPAPTGSGLNPLLQDPGLVIHPPMLYAGYVGFSVPFAVAAAALWAKAPVAEWAPRLRVWTLAPWTFLTLGIGVGAWWAYNELGWGGFWFWDPVENASLMPWLLGAALVHSVMVTERRGALAGWTLFLALASFSLSLLGTFLVRSGVLTSVHAFAVDPERGAFILALLAIVVGGGFTLFLVRGGRTEGHDQIQAASREGAILLNNLFLSATTAVVVLGTLYPLIIEAFSLPPMSVGAPYFNAAAGPLMLAAALFMGAAPLLGWRDGRVKAALRAVRPAGVLGLLVMIGVALTSGTFYPAFGAGIGVWAMAGALAHVLTAKGRRARLGLWGVTLAHFGVGLATLGVGLSGAYTIERIVNVEPGQTVDALGKVVTLERIEEARGRNYAAERAVVTLREAAGGPVTVTLRPERRWYPAERRWTTEAAIRTNAWSDLYVAFGEARPTGDGRTVRALRIYRRTGVPLLWAGGILMTLGGVFALLAQARRRRLAPAATGATSAADAPVVGEAVSA